MTGIYVRIRRDDGTIDNVEVDQMTDAEMERFIADQTNLVGGWRWVKALAAWIRDNVKEPPCSE